MVDWIIEKLLFNENGFEELSWKLTRIEGLEIYLDTDSGSECETRTYIKFSSENFNAPEIIKMEDEFAKQISESLIVNKTVKKIVLNGHEGLMRINYTPNIGDSQLSLLSHSLHFNHTLTCLDFSMNEISDQGAISLAEVILLF